MRHEIEDSLGRLRMAFEEHIEVVRKTNIYLDNAKNVREWFAFYGGEELGISLEHASIVWDAADKSHRSLCTCGNDSPTEQVMMLCCKKCGLPV